MAVGVDGARVAVLAYRVRCRAAVEQVREGPRACRRRVGSVASGVASQGSCITASPHCTVVVSSGSLQVDKPWLLGSVACKRLLAGVGVGSRYLGRVTVAGASQAAHSACCAWKREDVGSAESGVGDEVRRVGWQRSSA